MSDEFLAMSAEARFFRAGALWSLEAGGGAILLYAPAVPRDLDVITLFQALEDPGCVLVFLPGRAPAEFADALDRYLRDAKPAPLFLWVSNPEVATEQWQVTRAEVDRASWTVIAPVEFDLHGYGLTVPVGTAVAPDGAQSKFDFAGAAIMRAGSESLALSNLCLDLVQAPGAWRFDLDVRGPDAFGKLDCGLRYFCLDSSTGVLRTLAFPVLRHGGADPLRLAGRIDPLRLRDPARTHFAFADTSSLDCGLVTRDGRSLRLSPIEGDDRAARLSFHVAPDQVPGSGSADRHYLAPIGRFAVEATQRGQDPIPLLCGSSALEFVAIPRIGAELSFIPARPAFAPAAGKALTARGTTSWLHVQGTYHVQPEQAPLFAASADGDRSLLELMEFGLATVHETPSGGFPVVPLGACMGAVKDATDFDRNTVAPIRRAAIVEAAQAGSEPLITDADTTAGTDRIAVTRQGLAVCIGTGGAWQWLGLGQAGATAASVPTLSLTNLRGGLQGAFQSASPFLVLGDAAAMAPCGSVFYGLNAADFSRLRRRGDVTGWDPDLLSKIEKSLGDQGFPIFADRSKFEARVIAAASAVTPAQRDVLAREAAQLRVTVSEWTFRFSPERWRTGGNATYLLVKLVKGRSIADLAADPASWAWPAGASPQGPARAVADIAAIVLDARNRLAAGDMNYRRFVDTIDDPDWSGLLALSPELMLDAPAKEGGILNAGVDASVFAAHHLGFSTTQVKLGASGPVFAPTPVFGLIDYRDPDEHAPSEQIDFAFRIRQLSILIENSAIVSRVCNAELLVNNLFGSRCVIEPATHGANIALGGIYQEQQDRSGTRGSFAFVSNQGYLLNLPDGGPVGSVELDRVDMVPPGPGAQASFRLSGLLRFFQPDSAFDPFCWGPYYPIGDTVALRDNALRFGNLFLDVRWDGTLRPVFTLRDQELRFDLATSPSRPDSLAARFPAKLQKMLSVPPPAKGRAPVTPESLGFVNIDAPLTQGKLHDRWYGLVYRIDLGSLGALANSAPLAVDLLAAWSPMGAGGDDSPIFLGIKLPGADARLGVNLPLQGLLTLGFKSIEFIVHDPGNAPNSYVLCLRNFAVRLLGLSFPPGRNNIYLFGNPAQSQDSAVGWYAAYLADGEESSRAQDRLSMLRHDTEGAGR